MTDRNSLKAYHAIKDDLPDCRERVLEALRALGGEATGREVEMFMIRNGDTIAARNAPTRMSEMWHLGILARDRIVVDPITGQRAYQYREFRGVGVAPVATKHTLQKRQILEQQVADLRQELVEAYEQLLSVLPEADA